MGIGLIVRIAYQPSERSATWSRNMSLDRGKSRLPASSGSFGAIAAPARTGGRRVAGLCSDSSYRPLDRSAAGLLDPMTSDVPAMYLLSLVSLLHEDRRGGFGDIGCSRRRIGIAAALRPYVEGQNLAGAVTLVASPDHVLSLEAIGYSDVAAKVPMKTDDVFWIASMSKPITATALMMLVDERKVSLDDPVEKYLPEFRGQMLDRREGPGPARPQEARSIRSRSARSCRTPAGWSDDRPSSSKLDTLPLRIGTITYGLSPLQFEPGDAGTSTAIPASTRRAGSSRWSRASPTRTSCSSESSNRSG